ncbi:MAG: DNA replication and repair protein RecF [Treponemataceae bacterium]|nr:DNA replication and repair protein RecF [Treponemataceae bacterium]
MVFLSVSFYNFRNLKNDKIDLSSKEIFFVGQNGQGKSNILESLYYCAYGNSFRTHVDSEIVKKGEKEFSVRSLYQEDSGGIRSVNIFFGEGKKRIEKNGKQIRDRKELINTMPCILFCHDDLRFVEGQPADRRFFLDQSLSMYDVLYIDLSRRYKQALKNRNILIKEKKSSMIEMYDVQLAQNGLEIQKQRKLALFKFNEIFTRLYEQVAEIDGVTISYEPSWKEFGEGFSKRIPNENEILDLLKQNREKDFLMGTTLSGPHRDKIQFLRNGKNFVPIASMGQRRLIALLLRVSQAVFYSQAIKEKPVLLMDDVLLELDPEKRQRVTSLLPEYEQLFCTFLPGEPYERYKRSTTKIFQIEKGEWSN